MEVIADDDFVGKYCPRLFREKPSLHIFRTRVLLGIRVDCLPPPKGHLVKFLALAPNLFQRGERQSISLLGCRGIAEFCEQLGEFPYPRFHSPCLPEQGDTHRKGRRD